MVNTRCLLPQHQVKLPLPLFGGNFWVVLHEFIRQKQQKNQSHRYHFFLIMVNYPIFSLNYQIYISGYISNISISSQSTQTMSQKRVTFCNFWNTKSHRIDWFCFLELFPMIYQAYSVRSSV